MIATLSICLFDIEPTHHCRPLHSILAMHYHDTVLICRTVDVHPTRWSPPPRPDGPSGAPQENSTLERGKLLGWDQVNPLVLGILELKLMKC